MKSFLARILIALIIVMILLACNPASVQPLPIPANVTAAQALVNNSQPVSSELIEFIHQQRLFSMLIPTGWKIREEDSFATFTAPDETASILAAVENTGIPLDKAGFTNYISTTEMHNFSHLKDYKQAEAKMDDRLGIATVRSQFYLANEAQELSSIYIRKENVIINMRLQASLAEYPNLEKLFDQVTNSAKFDLDKASRLIPYNMVYDFAHPMNVFSLKMPTAWRYSREEFTNFAIDRFYSPDGAAWIENLTYDDGNVIKPSQAFTITANLVWELFAKDLRISEMKPQPDGSTRWVWRSDRNKIQGTTFYELRGTKFLMLSLITKKEAQEVFAPLFSSIILNYAPLP